MECAPAPNGSESRSDIIGWHTLTQDWDLEVTDRLTIAPISLNIHNNFCGTFIPQGGVV